MHPEIHLVEGDLLAIHSATISIADSLMAADADAPLANAARAMPNTTAASYCGVNPMRMPGFEHLSNEAPGGFTLRPFKRHGLETYWHPDSQILKDMVKVSVREPVGGHR